MTFNIIRTKRHLHRPFFHFRGLLKRSLLVLLAICLITAGILADHVVSVSITGPSTVAAETTSGVANATAATIDQATERAYAIAGKSVVYIVSQGVGTGSGIIYDASGDVVTNDHVIDAATGISVTLQNGKSYSATVVGADTVDDLAVIHINASNLTPAHFASAGSYHVGEAVLAIGNPLGLKGSVTSGLISGLKRVEQEQNGASISDAIQTSAPINPGNSGGALVALDGTVVGIPTLEQTTSQDGTTTQNIGFAIPSDRVVSIANQIIGTG
jgi:putative serine protease PepD